MCLITQSTAIQNSEWSKWSSVAIRWGIRQQWKDEARPAQAMSRLET